MWLNVLRRGCLVWLNVFLSGWKYLYVFRCWNVPEGKEPTHTGLSCWSTGERQVYSSDVNSSQSTSTWVALKSHQLATYDFALECFRSTAWLNFRLQRNFCLATSSRLTYVSYLGYLKFCNIAQTRYPTKTRNTALFHPIFYRWDMVFSNKIL